MLQFLPALMLALLPLAASASTPEAVPLERYEPLIKRSPFAPASAPVQTTPQPSFAKDYYLTGMATLGDKTFITISSRDNQTRFSLLEGESFDGITFSRVEWLPGVGKSRAVLIKDGTTASVSFDEVAMKAAPAPAPVVTQTQPNPQQSWGNRGGNNRWEGRRGRGRDRSDWSPEQRQYMREQRRAMFRAMHNQWQGQGQPGQQGQGNQFQRQQPINNAR